MAEAVLLENLRLQGGSEAQVLGQPSFTSPKSAEN